MDGGNSGLFVTTVDSDSPIGQSKEIIQGDRILEVAGVSITSSELKVFNEAYENSTSPVEFVVQSLQPAKVFAAIICHYNELSLS